MSEFKPGPWASEDDYSLIRKQVSGIDKLIAAGLAHYIGDKAALRSALRCMELVPVLVEALEAAQSNATGIRWLCTTCHPKETQLGGVVMVDHADNCAAENALSMARGGE